MRACELPEWPNHAASRFVEAAGLRWHVQRAGVGPPLLLVHGTGASTHSWRDVLPLLAARYSVIAPDLPGHACTSAADARRASLSGMGEGLAALLETLRVDPVYCVGHSAGAAILSRMALDGRLNPRVIVSLNGAFLPLGGAAAALFAPIARLLGGSSLLAHLLARGAGERRAVERLIASTGSRLDARGIALYAALVREPAHVAGALAMMGNWDLKSLVRDLPRLAVPLTLVVGGNDRTVPPDQAWVVKRCVPEATIVTLPGLGHLAHEEAPARTVQVLSEAFNARPSSAADPRAET
jgi:magnesium chelatase accessory protein